MKRAHWLMAATAALLPWPAAAQDCGAAIRKVEQNLQQVPQDEWYRAQVQLYLADQFQQKGVPESCFRAVREASNIVGMPPPPAPADSSGGMKAEGKPPSPEQAVELVGKPVRSTSGEKLGKIVDVIGKERGPLRFVMGKRPAGAVQDG